MFAETLRTTRTGAKVSVARLADIAHTSRSTIAEYEAGTKVPRFDTAERLFNVFDQTYTPVALVRQTPARLDPDVLAPLRAWIPDRPREVKRAREDQAVIVDADATAEHLDVTWGQIKTLVNGTTVTGDELSIWRIQELRESAQQVLRVVESGMEPTLDVIARGALISGNTALDVPRQAMDFLVRATQHGADPAFTRHLTGGFLAHHGYPWLWVPHRLDAEYRRALVACKRQGEGNMMVRVLIASLEKMH